MTEGTEEMTQSPEIDAAIERVRLSRNEVLRDVYGTATHVAASDAYRADIGMILSALTAARAEREENMAELARMDYLRGLFVEVKGSWWLDEPIRVVDGDLTAALDEAIRTATPRASVHHVGHEPDPSFPRSRSLEGQRDAE